MVRVLGAFSFEMNKADASVIYLDVSSNQENISPLPDVTGKRDVSDSEIGISAWSLWRKGRKYDKTNKTYSYELELMKVGQDSSQDADTCSKTVVDAI